MKRTTVLSLLKLSLDLPSGMLLPADIGQDARILLDFTEFRAKHTLHM